MHLYNSTLLWLLQVVQSKLPEPASKAYATIDDAFQDPYFAVLFDYFNNAEGDTENEKLENLFVLVENQEEKRVNVMSIHKSKGLGAEHVFMIGLVEGIIPNKAKGNDTIESQRRLFFVGMTRAKKNLHLLSNIAFEGRHVNTVNKPDFKFDFRTRKWKGRASRFIEEINR